MPPDGTYDALSMRVHRTLSFLDLCGFTAYTDGCGAGEAVGVLAHLRYVLRARAEDRGVRVTKWLGDGAILSGVDAPAVVECALAVRDTMEREGRLSLRGGICAGPVIMFEGDDYIGAAVNVAARLCRPAAPGQILVAERLHGCGAFPDATPLGAMAIDGVAKPIDVWALDAAQRRPGLTIVADRG